jgi:hypothetical protein
MTVLRARRGDEIKIGVEVVQEDGSQQDLTGSTLRFTAKDRASDPDGSAILAKFSPDGGITIDDAPAGLATVTIAAADTAGFTGPRTLLWDIQMTSGTVVKTLDDGKLYVLPDVTRA